MCGQHATLCALSTTPTPHTRRQHPTPAIPTALLLLQAQRHLDCFKAGQLVALLQLLAAWGEQRQQQPAAAGGRYQAPAALLDALSLRLRSKLAALVPEQVLTVLAAFAVLGYRPDSQVGCCCTCCL
jgi:hypothetical protein